jgi:glutamate--cysteine ligase
VNEAQIDFLDLFLLDCLLSDSPRIGDEECERLDDNYKDVVSNGRFRELKLCRAGERTPVSEAATDILAQLEPLAELLDSWRGDDTYRRALAAQRETLTGEWTVPSARVLDAMRSSGLGHREWGMEMAQQHQQTLRQEGLDPSVRQAFDAMTAESLAEQTQMERADTLPFNEFLEQYLRS